jgi:hypothetical protein
MKGDRTCCSWRAPTSPRSSGSCGTRTRGRRPSSTGTGRPLPQARGGAAPLRPTGGRGRAPAGAAAPRTAACGTSGHVAATGAPGTADPARGGWCPGVAAAQRSCARSCAQSDFIYYPVTTGPRKGACTLDSPRSRWKGSARTYVGRGERIRTSGILLPKQARYQAALRPEKSRCGSGEPDRRANTSGPGWGGHAGNLMLGGVRREAGGALAGAAGGLGSRALGAVALPADGAGGRAAELVASAACSPAVVGRPVHGGPPPRKVTCGARVASRVVGLAHERGSAKGWVSGG